MPTRLTPQTITNVSADVINSILNSGSIDYRTYIPQETQPNAESIREVGRIIMDSPNLRNNFATDLINRVIKVYVSSKSYESPTAALKKGMLEMGETVEDVFVAMAEAELYDPDVAETDVWKQRIPDIRTAFYPINYQVKYPVTIRNEQLRAAFLTQNGFYDLIDRIYQQLYTADAYDDFNMVKYMIAYQLVNGNIKAVATTAPTSPDNVRAAVTTIKATSNKMRFMKADYTIAGVANHAQHDEQTLFMSCDFDAAVDVEVLAAAFNMSKAEFLSKRLLVDSFGDIDARRLAACAPYLCDNIVYATAENGVQRVVSADLKYITADQLTALKAVPAVLIDDNFIQEYDRLLTMEDIRNPSGLYTNAYYHVWRTYATSPFAPAAVFDVTSGTPAVTSITLSPSTASGVTGGTVSFVATVAASGFISRAVTWSVTGANSDDTVIDSSGNLHIGADESATSLTVTATSVNNSSVTGSATVTVVTGSYSITYAGTAAVSGSASAIAGTLVTAMRNIGSTSSASGFTITVKQGTTDIPYTATVSGSGSNHVLNVKFTMPHGNATVTVSTT